MLALVHARTKWKHYLMGSTVLAYTDNVALKYWSTAENLYPRQVRWLAYIGMFDIEITHNPGVTNTAVDALSRLACPAVALNEYWKLDYIADTRLEPQLFDKAGVPRDPQQHHHGRVWDFDRIVVPRRRVRHVVAEAHSNIALVIGHLDAHMMV